ncbi:MAG: PEGA domain-containing protein [Sumerlaeia bacterium]
MYRALVFSLIVCCLSGCAGVRQKVVVTTEPAGADVTMNSVHLGQTPTEIPFTWYWYYDFKAEKDGYKTAITRERFRAPFYLLPGVDLLMEMMPFHVRDTRRVHLVMDVENSLPEPELAAY